MNGFTETTKHAIDAISVATVLGTLMNILPSIAAGLSIIWTLVRIYETTTVQKLLGRTAAKTDNSAE